MGRRYTQMHPVIHRHLWHDTLVLSNNRSSTIVINWREILPVYAVKAAADPENGMMNGGIENKTAKSLIRSEIISLRIIDRKSVV